MTGRLYGLVVYQVYRYNRLFPEDPLFLKGLVSHMLNLILTRLFRSWLWHLVGPRYQVCRFPTSTSSHALAYHL